MKGVAMSIQSKTVGQSLQLKGKRLLCLALAGACAASFGVVAAAVTASEANAMSSTAYLTLKQFDGSHVAYKGQTTETLAATGNSEAATKVKSSNKKIGVISYSGPGGFYVDFKKVGTTTVTYNFGGKAHTSKWTIKKFTNPFATFTTGTKNLKSYGKAKYFNGTVTGQASIYTGCKKDFVYQDGTAAGDVLPVSLQLNKKLVVKPSSGWKIYNLNADGKTIKSGAVISQTTGTVHVLMQNKKDKTIVHYAIASSTWG